MFQSFESTVSPDQGKDRVARLRARFESLGVDGVLVPRADEYLGEYVPACAERLAWLTGFTGSAGIVLVLAKRAIVFVDGRYTAQLAEQVDPSVFEPGDLVGLPPAAWLESNGANGLRIGIDPWLHTPGEVRRLREALHAIDGELVLLAENPVDPLWTDRPAPPVGKVFVQPDAFAGQPAETKLSAIRNAVREENANALVLTDPTSVAWSFNIRGADVPHTPYPLARAIVPATGRATIFIEPEKLDHEARSHLEALADVTDPAGFADAVRKLSGQTGARVMIDPAVASFAVRQLIESAGGSVIEVSDPVRLPRATKNAAELAGARTVHRQDAAAVIRFLAWLDGQEPGTVDEIGAVRQLEACRASVGEAMQMPLKDISFDTISGAGAHGAVIHYRVTERTNRPLLAGELFLVDSGAQYAAGTTDITRTVAIGEVGDEPKRFFTLVLKGMMGISMLRFPRGTRGVDIDAFARIALWQAGCDFAHGTGHGVGSYLSVHEGPQSISRRGMQELLPGMIISNEPGYYRNGAFGIRIENLVAVKGPEPIPGGDMPMLGFETLTLVPIDRRLIVLDLLSPAEIEWLDRYHARVKDEIAPLIDDRETREWLEAATRPLKP